MSAYTLELPSVLAVPVLVVRSDGAEDGRSAMSGKSPRFTPQEIRYDRRPTVFEVLHVGIRAERKTLRKRWIVERARLDDVLEVGGT